VAETVVDELEPVQVDETHGDGGACASRAAQGDLEMLAKQHAVGKPCERIMVREERELLLGRLASGDVADHAIQERDLSALVEDPETALQHPAHRAVGVQDAVLELERRALIDRVGDDLLHARAVIGGDDTRVRSDAVLDELVCGVAGDRLDGLGDELHRPVERRRAAVDRAGNVRDQRPETFAVPTTQGRFLLLHAGTFGNPGDDPIPHPG
jgi:hypothetical protein